MGDLISAEVVAAKIFEIRRKRVMCDKDLAKLYGVTTFNLNKAVKRNIDRFPEDFMFQLRKDEFNNLIFQNGISSWGGTRKMSYVFTEQGVAMLSSVLRSKRAIKANIQIMRAFVKLKELLLTHEELAVKLEALENKYAYHDDKIEEIFEAIRRLMMPPERGKKRIGFHT